LPEQLFYIVLYAQCVRLNIRRDIRERIMDYMIIAILYVNAEYAS